MEVKKIMTKNPACCTSDSTLQEVAHMMEMYDCGCIPVVDNHQEKRPIGTITDRDITIRTFSANKNPLEMKASDVMTTDIATVTPETSVQDCLKTMEEKQIRRILVVDRNGRCTGIVAQADLAEHVTDSDKTANFVREISESESDRSRETNYQSSRRQENDYQSNRGYETDYQSNRYQFNEGRNRQNSLSYSDNTSLDKSRSNYRKTYVEKESFFNTTTLLTLLGSIAIGAGLRYYLGPEVEDKPNALGKPKTTTGDFDAKITVGKKTTDSTTHTPSISASTTTPSITPSIDRTQNRETITGTVDSFNTTQDDSDLKPITEIGKTAGNN